MSYIAEVGVDSLCQDCGNRVWKASLVTECGRLHLCGGCAADYIGHREGKRHAPVVKLLKRVFGETRYMAAQ